MAREESSNLSETEQTPSDEQCSGLEDAEEIAQMQQATVRNFLSAEAENVRERNAKDRLQLRNSKLNKDNVAHCLWRSIL